MRKFLSLVLALVMMMSLVTINVGAKEFTDGDDITYQEAVDVISTIHVVDGYSDGDFKPGNNLTRGAAAKIICNMILGPTTAAELHADTAPYRDVPVTSDFAGYIAYCQKEGIISGYADGTFRPAGTLTGYAFMKMLLGALGYDAEIEGYTGPNWSINVAKKAIGLGLNKSLEKTFNGVDFVTREEAALYAFNTLKADLVEYSSKITANVNGAEVTVGNSNAEPQKWESQQTRSDNIYRDSIVQFAEQYFNKLVLTEDMDVFGRPDREWKYDGDEIGAYINMDLFKQEYTTKVTGKDLYELLGSTVTKEYSFDIHVDGEAEKALLDGNSNLDEFFFTQKNLIKSNTEGIGGTGNGVLTQVFVDNDKDVEHVWIAVINTYFAKATDDYNEKRDEVKLDVYALEEVTASIDGSTAKALVKNAKNADVTGKKVKELTLSGEDFDIEDVKEDDIFLVNVADNDVQTLSDPEVVEETTISSFKKGSWVNTEGEQVDYASAALYDWDVLDQYVKDNMKDTNYNLFLDPYGYMIGIEIVDKPTNYLFLTGIDLSTSNLTKKTADGNVIFLDGTMDTVRINMDKSKAVLASLTDGEAWDTNLGSKACALMNTWCTYTVNESGVYTVTEVADEDFAFTHADNTKKIGQSKVQDTATAATTDLAMVDKKHVTTDGITGTTYKKVYGNDDSVYISVDVDKLTATNAQPGDAGKVAAIVISDVDSVTTGVQNANITVHNAKKVKTYDAGWSTINETNTAHGMFTLFDKNGYVIAAIVIGEDNGSTTNYAYVISDSGNSGLDSEAYGSNEYTWTRKVVVNGEITTLTEKNDGSMPEIAGMVRGQWYEMKYKADGTVKSKTLISWGNGDTTAGSYEFYDGNTDQDTKFVGLIDRVEYAVVENDTVVLSQNLTGATNTTPDYYAINPSDRLGSADPNAVANGIKSISVEGNTLQIETNTNSKEGFAVRADAKIVLVQDAHVYRDGVVKSVKEMYREYEYDNGVKGLEKAIKNLNGNGNFVGFVSAVFDGGVASSVVIWDQTQERINAGDNTPASPVGTLESSATINELGLSIAVSYTDLDFQTPITKALEDAGYTLAGWGTVAHPVTVGQQLTASKDGVTKTFTIANPIVHFSTIKINGADVPKQDGITVAAALGVPATADTFVKDGAGNYIEVTDPIVAGTNYIPTLYAEITIGASPATKVLATSTVGAATSKTPSATVFMKQTVGATDTYVATNSTVVPGATYDDKEYVAVTVTSAVDSTGATTGFGDGATTATAALKSTETGYFEKGTTGDVSITVTIVGAATADAVNVTAAVSTDGGTAAAGTVKSGGTIAGSTAVGDVATAVVVTLTTAQTAGAVNIALTVAD